MRIKILKPVIGRDGKSVEPGEFLTVDDEAVAKQYVTLGYAEEAPEAPDVIGEIKGLLTEFTKGLVDATKAASRGPRSSQIENGESELDKKKSLGHQLQLIGIACNNETTPRQRAEADETLSKVYGSRFREWDTKASVQVESSGPLGGYGVFPEFTATIFKLAIERTILASRARKVPMSTNELRYPKLDQTGTNTAGQYTGLLGGVIAGWSGETKNPPQTNAKLKQGVLKAGELMGYTQLSNEFLADNAVGFEAMITSLFSEAIAYYTDLATLTGDGVDKPQGVLTAACTLSVSPRTTSGHFNYADAVAMKSLLLAESESRAFWVFNKTVQPDLYLMKDGASRNLWLPNIPGGGSGPVAGQNNRTFLDLPYVFTEKTPALGTVGDVMVIDPEGYLLGERMSLEVAASPHVAFLAREMTYRFVARIAGQPVLDLPYTMLDGTNKLSTFVTLAT